MNKFSSISIRLATPEDKYLPVFDNTKLVALDTCNRFGILSYQMHKAFEDSKKSQALTTGTAMHEVFAAVRLWQLCWYDLDDTKHNNAIVDNQGIRLFKHRWDQIKHYFDANTRDNLIGFCLAVLHTSNFEEDPDDKKRTFSALGESSINYINRWDMSRYPIWIRDKNDPNTDVGIEIGYELVITFIEDKSDNEGPRIYEESYRFTGKLDGIHYDPDITNPDLSMGGLFVSENKTTSIITDNWGDQYEMATQPIGYMIAAKEITGQSVINAQILLSSVPVPAKSTHGGFSVRRISKEEYAIERWFDWFYNIAQVERKYKDNPFDANISPHSCYRYFRSCSMLPFCTASNDEQREILDEMVTREWNVLAEDNAE